MKDHFKAPFFVLLVASLATIFAMVYYHKDDMKRMQRAETIIKDLAEERRQLHQKVDSLKLVAQLRHPETLWLARAIYSETNRPEEMRLVAWVIRNRVEQNFRGKSTYKDVVLDPKQFSAFNRSNGLREYYMTKTTADVDNSDLGQRWKKALVIANEVRTRPPVFRPFSKKTLYFYSEVSMPRWKPHPHWRSKFERVSVVATDPINVQRFRFYKDPKCRLCGEDGPIPGVNDGIKTASLQAD